MQLRVCGQRLFSPDLLVDVLGKNVLGLKRAHCTLKPKPAEGGKPRAVIICFHKFQTKDVVICAARKKRGKLKYDGMPVYIYEDYCPEVLDQGSEYKDVMRQLYVLNHKLVS